MMSQCRDVYATIKKYCHSWTELSGLFMKCDLGENGKYYDEVNDAVYELQDNQHISTKYGNAIVWKKWYRK